MLNLICHMKLKRCCFFIILCTIAIIIKEFFLLHAVYEEIPVLSYWTQFHNLNDRLITCSNKKYKKFKCLVTTNRTGNTNLAAYLFYGSHIENHDFPLPRNYNIPWAIFHEESPKNYAPFLFMETQNIFNLSSTFSRYSDFPVTLQYLEDLSLIKDLKYYIPIHIKNKYLNEIAPVLYIQSDCDTPLSRDYFVKKLGTYIKIDSYGKCLRNKTFPEGISDVYPLDLYNEKLLRFISKYKFIIAFENAICDDYITEKLWRPLIVGSIPIYLGSPTIEDWLPNRNSAILVKNFNSLEDVANLVKIINSNNTLYESYIEHKLKSKISNDLLEKSILRDSPIPDFECFVCEQTHRLIEKTTKTNMAVNIYMCPKPNTPDRENTWDQHWDIGKCQSKALKMLLDKNKPYTSSLFEETWKTMFYNNKC